MGDTTQAAQPDAPAVGEAEWARRRAEWLARRGGAPRPSGNRTVLPRGVTPEDLLSASRPFPTPVPLQEVVELLVEAWEEEGLYNS